MVKQKRKVKPAMKLLGMIVVVGVIFGAIWWATDGNIGKTLVPKKDGERTVKRDKTKTSDDVLTIDVGVVTWGGYAGGQYFNRGFKANEKSEFYKRYGFYVNFVVLDDFDASRAAFKNGSVDLLWGTIDAVPCEFGRKGGLASYKPKVVFQADWSRGGDAVVATRLIKNVADLKGKKIAVAEMTPSHTFLIWLLESAGLTMNDVTLIKVASAMDAAARFKDGKVDAAVVWSPDDDDCINTVNGSWVLQSTKNAKYIIADIFFAKEEFLTQYATQIDQFVEGWLLGSSQVNSSDLVKQEAAEILEIGLGMDYEFCYNAINNVRLCTKGDNENFFKLNRDYTGISGEELYTKMSSKYTDLGYADNPLSWREIAYKTSIRNLSLSGNQHLAEATTKFKKASKELETKEAISSKSVTITFATNSYVLDDNAKYIIDREMVDLAKMFEVRVRLEGNSDNVGDRNYNIKLSRKRAQAVADYLVQDHHIDRNRFIVLGVGPDNPIADNSTLAGRAKNRRTDFELVSD